jgi:BASS family bile acid:Na+ symporter
VRPLAFIGRHATKFLACGVVLGLVVPPLAALAKPLLVPALLIPLALALVRMDWGAIGAYRRRPAVVVALVAWILLLSPLVVWLVVQPLARAGLPAALAQALVLMALSSPIVSSVALALILGLDATLAIVAVLVATALVPLTLPPLALTLTGIALELSLSAFMLRLALLVGSAFAAAWLVRRLIPAATLVRHHALLDGLSVVNLVVFAVAIMDGVTAFARERPGYVAAALVAAYLANLLLQVAGYAVFRRLGRRGALTAGLLSGNCNMGLVLVALQDRANFEIVVYFALAQIPMYTLPALLHPLYRRVLAAPRAER